MIIPLANLNIGESAVIRGFSEENGDVLRLMELGFLRGEKITVLHEGPWRKDPMAVEVRGTRVGLRRVEATVVLVETP